MSERPPKISIPLKRIEKLIEFAKEHNLAILEVGHIKIVTYPEPVQLQPGANTLMHKSKYEQELEAAQKDGKPLTVRQLEDAILFGPNGVSHNEQ